MLLFATLYNPVPFRFIMNSLPPRKALLFSTVVCLSPRYYPCFLIFNEKIIFIILSIVTLLQKDIVWGRGNKVVAVGADSSSSSNLASPKDPKGKGRPRKASSEEDRLLIAALRSGKAVERNERQSNELEHLKAGAYIKLNLKTPA